MIRMSRILLLAALCGLPSFAVAQEFPAGEEKQPAPGEPSGAAAEGSETIERFDRGIQPIAGTEPAAETDLGEATELGEATDEPPTPAGEAAAPAGVGADEDQSPTPASDVPAEPTAAVPASELRAEFQKLRQEMEQRLVALERRLDEQVARIDALNATTITAAKPAEGAEAMDNEAAQQRDEQLAQLRQDLEQLRSDLTGQLREITDAPAGETTTAARPAVTVEAHRLRIHNTTGVEQPISINGVQWTVRADEWSSVPIPRGPVTVNRPGHEPLEIAAEQIDWQSDRRGYYFDYDLDEHRLAQPTEE